jgi:hypothetical protein
VREVQQPIQEADLQRWRLIERFQSALAEETERGCAPSWGDPRRQLKLDQYLGLYLFGLFNPVVTTMRGLCEATKLARVQREVSGGSVSLGSFSEAQAVVNPSLLEAVFSRLYQDHAAQKPAVRALSVIDSTVMRVVPRMSLSTPASL